MKTRVLAAAFGAIFVVTGCASSDSDDAKADDAKSSDAAPKNVPAGYCTELQESIKSVLGPDGSDKLQDVVAEYTKLAASGPAKVGEGWRTLEKAYGDLIEAFDKINVDINDPKAARKAVDDKRVDKKIVDATESSKIQDAVKVISDHSVKSCGFDMTGKKAEPTPKASTPKPSGATPK